MMGIGWYNLMRPPGVTVRENRITLGTFKPGPYVIRIALANQLIPADKILVKNIPFTVK